MSDTATGLQKKKKQYACSCGAEFAHGISLRRHQRVTGHTGEKEDSGEPETEARLDNDSTVAVNAAPVPPVRQATEAPIAEEFVPRPASAFFPERATEPENPTVIVIDLGQALLLFYAFSAMATKYTGRLFASFGEAAGSTGRLLGQVLARAIPLTIALAFLTAGIVGGRGLAGAMMQPAQAMTLAHPPRMVTPQEQAAVSVMSFFQAVETRTYPSAYALLTDAWQAELPYFDFQQGFDRSHTLGCTVHGAHPIAPGTVQVQVSLSVLEGGSTATYAGSYLVVETPEGWRIDRGWTSRI